MIGKIDFLLFEPLYEVLNEPLDKSSFKIFDQKITNIGKIKT